MSGAKFLALAGATALLSTATFAALSTATLAADLPPPLPPPVYRAPVAVETGGWYLRGDVGVGIQRFKTFDFTQTNVASGAVWPASWRIDLKDIKDTFFIGGGIGFQWNNWLRFDFTAEHRADVKFKAVGSFTEFCPGGVRCFDVFDGDHSAVVVLANLYFDLGTWWCLTPFVGVGAGGARHRTTATTDFGFINGSSAFGFANEDSMKWTFAWAAHAGLAYNVTNNFKVEFAYRFLSMGNATTAEILCGAMGCGAPGGGPRAFFTLTGLESHDFKIGMRWLLQPEPPPPAYPPPLMRKG
jgi:opacity protein-like surface antigen